MFFKIKFKKSKTKSNSYSQYGYSFTPYDEDEGYSDNIDYYNEDNRNHDQEEEGDYEPKNDSRNRDSFNNGFSEDAVYSGDEADSMEKVNLTQFNRYDVKTYIKNQCDIIAEASSGMKISKEEYVIVTAYCSDVQMIQEAPQEIQDEVRSAAKKIDEMIVDRRIFKSTENKMPNKAYVKMERIESSMPKALIELQNDESYFNTVKKDMKMIEGERTALRYDARDLTKRQLNIKSISTFLITIIGIAFVIFIAANLIIEDSISSWFIAVVFMAAFLAVTLFAFLKSTERQVLVTENKINKATGLLNKVKIKYINIAGKLDYQYEKLGVKNSYELGRKYELYLEMKREKQKIRELTGSLDEAETKLVDLLDILQLNDAHIWLAQIKALIDPKEMVEIKHGLNVRRQKLRNSIEYNQRKIDESKQLIQRAALNYPEIKIEIMDILSRYEDSDI